MARNPGASSSLRQVLTAQPVDVLMRSIGDPELRIFSEASQLWVADGSHNHVHLAADAKRMMAHVMKMKVSLEMVIYNITMRLCPVLSSSVITCNSSLQTPS